MGARGVVAVFEFHLSVEAGTRCERREYELALEAELVEGLLALVAIERAQRLIALRTRDQVGA